MKYRLKKDLPKYKAGTVFRMTSKGHLAVDDTMVFHKNELEKYPNILTEWFEEIPEKPKTVWDLKTGDKCWRIDGAWDKGYASVIFGGYTETIRELGELFMTEEEAKQEVARRRAKQILLRDTKGFKSDWSKVQASYFQVVYNRYKHSFAIILVLELKFPGLCFSNRNDAEASVKAHPNEWKTYLGVEDEE